MIDFEKDIKQKGVFSEMVQRITTLEDFMRAHQTVEHVLTPLSGWVPYLSAWTRVTASTFTVTGNQTTIFQPGTKLKFDQTTTKYASVRSSSYSAGTDLTTVTIHVNTNFTLTAAAITNPFFSYVENPQGWAAVEWFDWTTTHSAGTMTLSAIVISYSKFKVLGSSILWRHRSSMTTGGVATNAINITPPTTILNIGANSIFLNSIVDAASENGRGSHDSTNNLLVFQRIPVAVWTLGANRTIIGEGIYQY